MPPRFVMTPSGRIMLRADWMREQENIAGRKRYEQREQLQREWRAAVLADVADTVSETAEPKICQCGKHYTTNPDWHTSRACDECGADTTEPCRPYCTGQAAHDDETNNDNEEV